MTLFHGVDERAQYEYAITSRKTRQPITVEHYEDFLSHLGDISRNDEYDGRGRRIRVGGLGDVGNVNYEEEKGLHVHYILKTNRPITSNDLYKYHAPHGWNHKAIPIFNRRGWLAYIRKNQRPPEELEHPETDNIIPPRRKLFN